EARELGARLVGHARVLGPLDDRRERSVDVEEECRPLRLRRESREKGAFRHRRRRRLRRRLGTCGLAFARRRRRPLGSCSLAGAVAYSLHGELKTGAALIVGVPAAFGAYTGAALQQRLAMRTLTLAFAGLVIAIGIRLLL